MGSFSGQVIHTHTRNIVPERLAERVWCPKSQSPLLNINFRLIRFQSSLLLESFRFEDENEYKDLT